MRFAIVGAGAVGTFVGARLREGGAEVLLIARGAQLEALRQQRGARVVSDSGEVAVELEASGELEALAGADVVIVALKAYSLPALAPRLGSLLAPGTPTIWAQNGVPWWYFQGPGGALAGLTLEAVDPGAVIARSIPADGVIGSVVYPAVALERPGVVRHIEGTRLTLGELDGSASARANAISDALRAGGLRAPVVADLRPEIWLKLLGNATFNPMTALTGATLGELEQARGVLLEACREVARVAAALGVELAVSPERRLEAGLAVGNHKTSMLQDLEAGKPLEYACMTTAVIEIARHVDVDVPRLEMLDACVALLDRRAQRPERRA